MFHIRLHAPDLPLLNFDFTVAVGQAKEGWSGQGGQAGREEAAEEKTRH